MKIFTWFSKIMTYILCVILCLFVFLAIFNFISVSILKDDYANYFGYTFFEVVSGSMSPSIEKGDLILVKLSKNFNEGDIISYKSNDGAIITHRVIDIDGNSIITKGDYNNTEDSAFNRENVIGKVIKIFPNVGTWISVVTTPKVIVSIIITISLIGLSCTYFTDEKKDKPIVIENNEDEEIDGEEEEDMSRLTINRKLIIELGILFFILIVLAILIPYTLSRFKSEARGTFKVDVAFYCINANYTHQSITLEQMKPGDSKTYTFSVSNFEGSDRTEVNLKYYIEVLATTNLPLNYTLNRIEDGNRINAAISDQIITDEDDTYFRVINTDYNRFSYSANKTYNYELVINFPIEYHDYSYQDVSENIQITVKSLQDVDS